MQEDAGTQTGAGAIRPWFRLRVPEKRPNPRADEVPESKKERTVAGTDTLYHVCEEAPLRLPDNEEALIFSLDCEHEENLEANDICGLEQAGGSSSSSKLSFLAPLSPPRSLATPPFPPSSLSWAAACAAAASALRVRATSAARSFIASFWGSPRHR